MATWTRSGKWPRMRRCLGVAGLSVWLAGACATALPAPVAGAASAATSAWAKLTPSASPSPRFGAAMAYDPGTGQTVLFGGLANDPFHPKGYLNDTWAWKGKTWTWQFPATSPPGRALASMAYDPATGQLLLFGGFGFGGVAGPDSNDTWDWNGRTWTRLNPGTSPQARYGASMAYDPSTGQMVLFGGLDNNSNTDILDDTWTWNGSTWTQLSPTTSPSARFYASMAYDPGSSQLVLFGGDNASGQVGDTWTWNGNTWRQSSPATSPPARSEASMVYDPSVGQLVLFGGQLTSTYGNDTWTWNGSTWTQQRSATNPSARKDAPMVFDGGTGQLVLFGGVNATGNLGDTWSWNGFLTTTNVLIPWTGANQSANRYLDAGAPAGVTKVQYELSRGPDHYTDKVISGSWPTNDGWIGGWNTTSVPNGRYVLQSVASYADGVSDTSAGIIVTVNNQSQG